MRAEDRFGQSRQIVRTVTVTVTAGNKALALALAITSAPKHASRIGRRLVAHHFVTGDRSAS